jgi:hypothetical protein
MGVSGQHHAPAALYPRGKDPPVPIVQEAGWAPEPVWTQRLEEKSVAPAGDRTPIASMLVGKSFLTPNVHRMITSQEMYAPRILACSPYFDL